MYLPPSGTGVEGGVRGRHPPLVGVIIVAEAVGEMEATDGVVGMPEGVMGAMKEEEEHAAWPPG